MIGTEGSGIVSARALSAGQSGFGAEFVPPTYIEKNWIAVARGASPFLQLSPPMDLPPGTLSLVLPRLDTGNVLPATENTAPAGHPLTTDSLTQPVIMITGSATLSKQLLDRSPAQFDDVVARDAALAFADQFQCQLVTGAGTGESLLGILNVPSGLVSVAYTSATPSVAGLVQAVASCAAQVADARKLVPTIALARGARAFWIAGTADGSTNVSSERVGTGLQPRNGSGPFGPVAGLPLWTADAVPANLGAGANQDAVVVTRPEDFLLFADAPRISVWDEGAGAGQLSAVVNWRCYVSAFINAYASSGYVTGTGTIVQTGF